MWALQMRCVFPVPAFKSITSELNISTGLLCPNRDGQRGELGVLSHMNQLLRAHFFRLKLWAYFSLACEGTKK